METKEIKIHPKENSLLRFIPDEKVREEVANGCFVKSENISRGVGSVVDLSAAIGLSGAYRMVIPPGAIGKVMTYVSNPSLAGTLSATMVSQGGNFSTSIGYASMSAMGAVFMIYSVTAFLTGQYFFTTISKKLAQIQKSIEGIRELILNIEDSHFEASCQYLEYVLQSSQEIVDCERLRVATLTNVQRLNIKNRSYHILNMKELRSKSEDLRNTDADPKLWDSDKLRKIGSLRPELMKHCRKAALSLTLHAYFAAVECELSGIVTPKILDTQFQQVKKLCEHANEEFEKIALSWESVSHKKECDSSKEIKRFDLLESRDECRKLSQDVATAKDNFELLVDRLKNLSSKPIELLWIDGDVYVPSSLA
jgi:hypothetical protein